MLRRTCIYALWFKYEKFTHSARHNTMSLSCICFLYMLTGNFLWVLIQYEMRIICVYTRKILLGVECEKK